MKSVHEHLAQVLSSVGPVDPLGVVLSDAVGCILAEDIVASTNLPRADSATRDGYAVRAVDVADATHHPVTLPVVADAPIGSADPMRITPGGAVRIMSGASMPYDSDAVVAVEDTDRGMASVAVRSAVASGDHVRRCAADVAAGDVVLAAGTRIGARQLALLAALGYGRVNVHPRPRVVVVSIGDELIEPGRTARAGQVFDANGITLCSAILDAGATAFRVWAVPDERVRLRETLEDQLVRADLIVTTGGLSAGQGDTVREVLGPLGTVRFDNVAMSPGRQHGVGVLEGDIPIVALPGHPVAAYVAYEVFVRPALRKIAGWADLYWPAVEAVAVAPWRSPAGRREFVRATVLGDPSSGYTVQPVRDAGEPLLSDLAGANALAVVAESVDEVRVGDRLTCMVLDG